MSKVKKNVVNTSLHTV